MKRTRPAPRWRRWLRRALRVGVVATLGLVILFFALAYALPLPARLTVRDSVVVEYADGTAAHVFLSADERWRIAPTDLDPAYVDALLRLEDKRFWDHPGVDLLAIGRAFGTNVLRGRRVSGASTITMQLVRLLEPRPRTYRSKLVEAFRALQLELFLDKREILHHYLRFVPYGRNVEGVEAAALAYFGHRADALTPAEIATLLAVPQGPRSRAPGPTHTETLRLARDDIAQRLLAQGALHAAGQAEDAAAVLRQVAAAAVPTRFLRFPREVRHAAVWLRARAPGDDRIPTTLDRGAQRLAESRLANAADGLRAKGVYNGAVVVVEHETGAVRALVGNPRFDDPRGGQIAAFTVPRSTGSTLKPFLFALAIDQGLALPGFLVSDVPVRYGSYTPTNFDGRYDGLVRLEDALARSLNVPFVDLLARLGVERVLAALRALGARHLATDPGWYGLSVAVGGVELTPLELTGLYAHLAQGGAAPALRVRRDADPERPRRVFGAGAAWLTQRALARRDRPDFPRRRRLSGVAPAVHWKTGTSAGHRDAWAVGSDGRYSVTVWLGNLDNTPSRALVGAEAAGPLLFDVIEGLGGHAAPSEGPPASLVAIDVCADTGWPATPACPQITTALAPRGSVPVTPDPYHVRLQVDAEGRVVTPACAGPGAPRWRSVRVWPPAVRRVLAERGRALPALPQPAPGCDVAIGAPPHIVSPAEGQTILRVPGLSAEDQAVPLVAGVDVPVGRLTWFVDGARLGEVPPDTPLWWPPSPGQHEVRVVDARGRAAARRVLVRD